MRIAREEIFGPVLSILRWTDEEEMFAAVDDVEYGLTAGVFIQNIYNAMRAIRKIGAGYVWVNNSGAHFTGLPFGGVKQSGIEREECLDEFLAFAEQKSVPVSF